MKKVNLVMAVLFVGLLLTGCNSEKKEKESENATSENAVVEETASSLSGGFVVDSDASYLNWVGSKPGGSHNGTIVVESGDMTFEGGNLVSGQFNIDMTSIDVADLEGKGKMDLENHLKGTVEGKENHFFNVAKYPKSSFKITSVNAVDGKQMIKGELTIKDKTNVIEFEGELSEGANQQEIKLTSAPFKIDRTKWGIEFMSKSIFDDLKDKFIDDEIELSIMVKGKKKA